MCYPVDPLTNSFLVMSSSHRVYGPTDPWPFRFMEVGDKVVCLRDKAAGTAHAYGASTRKRFSTETRSLPQPDGSTLKAVKVTRLPDDPAVAVSPKRAARRAPMPWVHIQSGSSWKSEVFPSGALGEPSPEIMRLRSRVYACNVRLAAGLRRQLAQESAAVVEEFNMTARTPFTGAVVSYVERYPLTTFRVTIVPVVGGHVLHVIRQDPDTSAHLSQVRRILEAHRVSTLHREW